MKSVLEFSPEEARSYFLKSESYARLRLPPYFNFDDLINKISKGILDKRISDFYNDGTKPWGVENVNLNLLDNKDGRFSWRPFELTHPVLYVSLVHQITEEESWNHIIKRFERFKNQPHVECYSLPVESTDEDIHNSDDAAGILKWWSKVEQRSIELALDFQYLLQTDVTDCYGSIYTHSLPWALHTKEKSKERRKDPSLVGNVIDDHLKSMSYGQTNGIPQGNRLSDFIAEIVLGYADLRLSEKIGELNLASHKIIRFRDDYRIYTNNPSEGEKILKCWT